MQEQEFKEAKEIKRKEIKKEEINKEEIKINIFVVKNIYLLQFGKMDSFCSAFIVLFSLEVFYPMSEKRSI